jgi:hypothetical protein
MSAYSSEPAVNTVIATTDVTALSRASNYLCMGAEAQPSYNPAEIGCFAVNQ